METKELNLKELLKGHEGEKFYSTVFGNVTLKELNDGCPYPITITSETTFNNYILTSEGKLYDLTYSECVLFPSKKQRDWTKWKQTKLPKIWRDMYHCDVQIWEIIKYFDYGSVNPFAKSAVALLKIHQLIEAGYGGNITKEEWENHNVSKYTIDYYPKSGESDIINTNRFNHIAFHTYGQAKEFISYPENVKLIKVFCML